MTSVDQEREDYADDPDQPPSWVMTKVVYPAMGLLVFFTFLFAFLLVCLWADSGCRQMVGPGR
jgi:hypothetical protein